MLSFSIFFKEKQIFIARSQAYVTKDVLDESFVKCVDEMKQFLYGIGVPKVGPSYHNPIFHDEEEEVNPKGMKGNNPPGSPPSPPP
jgi:hypothetical protein